MYKLNASAQNYRIAFYFLVWMARPKNPRKWVFIPFTRKHINNVRGVLKILFLECSNSVG